MELPGQQGRGGQGALRLEPVAPEAGALAHRPDDPATERKPGEGPRPLTPAGVARTSVLEVRGFSPMHGQTADLKNGGPPYLLLMVLGLA